MKNKKNKYILIAKMAAIAFICGFGIESIKTAPNNARVLITDETNYFYPATSDYFQFMNIKGYTYKITTIENARNDNKEMYRDAKERGYFIQHGRSLSGSILEKIGLLPKIPSRWDSSGNWKF